MTAEKENHSEHYHHHGHIVDPSIISTERGIWVVKLSFVGLLFTALLQAVVVLFSGSVALLADTIHNFGDAATSLPLWFAFILAGKEASKRFSYGYGRVEDLAGLLIVVIIFFSGLFTGYETMERLLHPREIRYLWAVVGAAIIGFLGNEAVALFRIKVGREMGSAALVADGYHARVDGLSSLSVLLGGLGVWLGYPLADPVFGLLITVMIFRIVWSSGKSVFTRLLDGVDPEVIDDIRSVATETEGVDEIGNVRVRWLGHRLNAEVNIGVRSNLSVEEGHKIADQLHHELSRALPYLSNTTIHLYPLPAN